MNFVINYLRRLKKEKAEFTYWSDVKTTEGNLANEHYTYFYTEHFSLDIEFYHNKKILDLGCGPRGSLEWADLAAERVGLDPLVGRYKQLGIDHHKMQYVEARSEKIPFPEKYFDVVCSFNSLDHVDNLDQTIQEIIRVTKPGGFFLLLTDVNHKPTACEPISFSWDIKDKFLPAFDILDEKRYEKKSGGLYESIRTGIVYDATDVSERYGVLSVKFKKLSGK